jgi:hypothetical protein
LLAIALFSGLVIWQTQGPAAAQDKTPAVKADKKAKGAAALTPANFPGKGAKLDAPALTRLIDEQIQKRLDAEEVKTSPPADDAEFLRRAYLDLIGVIPPVEKVKEFLDSKAPDKREKLIEELLANPRFGQWMGENYVNAMVPRDSNNRLLQGQALQTWLADHFNKNTPYDQVVSDLLTATGPMNENGAVTYFVANATADKITDNVTRLFMGVQLQCAQCHNHPFTDYKQKEYWGMAAFFMKVRMNVTPQQAAKKGVTPTITEDGAAVKGKKKGLPEGAMIVPARFLQGEEPKLAKSDPYRPVLAKWMTARDNPYFARAMVNKMWFHFFGRGLVNPHDDMHGDNPSSHPELLAALAEQFKNNNFDVKYLIRAIVSTQTYQCTSRPHAGNEGDTELFSHPLVRTLSPEQMYDSLVQVVGAPGKGETPFKKGAAPKKGPAGPRAQFIAFFRVEDGADPLEYQAGIPQALRLMNSAQLNNTNALVTRAMNAGNEPAQVIEYLYMATLARRPTSDEQQRRVQYVQQQADRRAAYGDILWALLNCSEFALNH